VTRLSWLCAFLFAAPSLAAGPAAIPVDRVAEDYTRPHRSLEVEPGRRMNLYCTGSGSPTVVFDSGLSDWSATWALIQPAVAMRTRACSYDRAGMGYSDAATRPPTPANAVHDLHTLLAKAKIGGPMLLVGHSLGGFNMKLYAATHPQQVAGLVLVDPSEERLWPRVGATLAARFGEALVRDATADDASSIAAGIAHFRGCADEAKRRPLDDARYAQCTDPVRIQLGETILAERRRLQSNPVYFETQAGEFEHSMFARDERADARYAKLFGSGQSLGDIPLIVLTHSQWEMTPPFGEIGYVAWLTAHRDTAALSARGEQRMVPMSRHNIQIDQPQAVIDAISEVLDELQAAPPHDTAMLQAAALGETRRVNVYLPPDYVREAARRYPVLYLPDGGEQEDFPHVAAAADRLMRAGQVRPFIIVGIENTVRRRDMTPPTQTPADLQVADQPGGAARFRQFIATELMPWIRQNYRVDDEAAIMGESLAGLFVVDTLWREPALFDTYIALDPSLWWNARRAVQEASARLAEHDHRGLRLLLASAGAESNAPDVEAMVHELSTHASPALQWKHFPHPDATHATLYRSVATEMLMEAFARSSP
jgi:predicted alpha/beta superfamily hydrolase/pimeloyl-ACP methyl ester carboxylesterase